MPKRFLLAPLLALSLLATPAAADRLLVAGPDGILVEANTDTGVFTTDCACFGPVRALAADQQYVYAVDDGGQLRVLDTHTLQQVSAHQLGPVNALAAAGGALHVGTEDGIVTTIDPLSGATLDTRTVPAGVRTLLIHGGRIFAGAADSAVYSAPVEGGAFEYFSCFCFFNIQGMAMLGDLIAIVDEFGTTALVDLEGNIVNAFSVGTANSLAVLDGELLFYYAGSGGTIWSFDPAIGGPGTKVFSSPVEVGVMLVLPDAPRARRR